MNKIFSFTKKQKILEIDDIKIGGQPGRYPTVLFGGLFFEGELDIKKGEVDLNTLLEASKKTGMPGIPDFFIRKKEYVEDIVNFIQKTLPENYPFSVDFTDPEVKIETLKKLHENNLLSRTIYNSIHVGVTDKEEEMLEEYTPAMAIIVGFNPKDKSPDGKIEVLENGAHLIDSGLLDIAKKVGINGILIDTAALSPGDYSGAAISSIPVVKEEYGLPAGCAIHNVVEKSEWLNNFKLVKKSVDASSNINISLFGGDFAIFGPASNSDMVFPIMAWEDILISEYTENYFDVKPSDSHPRRKLL